MTTILEKTAGLVAFVRAAEAGSFTAAARSTGSTPSAVSKSVARLERRLGARLFQRSTRTLALTAEGSAYYERVAPLLRAIEDAEDVVQAAETARGLLRVTMPTELGRPLIGPLTRIFLTRHPAVKLELNFTDRHVDLIREGYDVALRIGTLADTELAARKLADLPIVLIASPDYLARHGVPRSVADLGHHAFLRYILGGRPFPVTFADGTIISPDGPLDTDIGFALREGALNGAGITQLMRFSVEEELRDGRLVRVLPDVPLPVIPVNVLHAFGRQPPVRARLFIDFIAAEVARLKP